MSEAEYPNLSVLRGQLTADDPDERAQAYSSVLQADLDVSDVLSNDPPAEKLAEAGIIPTDDTASFQSAAKNREKMVTILEDIRDLLEEQ